MLLIVDGHDDVVLGLNRQTQTMVRAPSKIAIVTHPGANPVRPRRPVAALGRSQSGDVTVAYCALPTDKWESLRIEHGHEAQGGRDSPCSQATIMRELTLP